MNHKKTRHPHGVKPPIPPRKVRTYDCLPKAGRREKYELMHDDGTKEALIVTGVANNRTLKGLIQDPLYCASDARISQCVSYLRHAKGVRIATDEYHADNPNAGGAGVFGVFTLQDSLRPVDGGAGQ